MEISQILMNAQDQNQQSCTKVSMHKRILYINSFSTSNHHEMINAGLLAIVSNINKSISVFSSKSNYANIKRLLDDQIYQNIEFHSLFAIHGTSRWSWLLRYIFSALQNIKILILSNKNDILFYNFNNVFSLRIINFINKIRKQKIIIICHGELELLKTDNEKKGKLAAILRYVTCNFFFE